MAMLSLGTFPGKCVPDGMGRALQRLNTDYVDCMATDKPILNFVIETDLLRRVDDFRYKHRFPTRAAAVKWMLKAALDAKLQPLKVDWIREKTASAVRE
jgi:hypothetical protein